MRENACQENEYVAVPGQQTRERNSPTGDNQGHPQNPSPDKRGSKIVTDIIKCKKAFRLTFPVHSHIWVGMPSRQLHFEQLIQNSKTDCQEKVNNRS